MSNLITLLNKYHEPKSVNIGSGPRPWFGWHCFDQVVTQGVHYCEFSEKCSLNLESETMELVYSSHCFEHLEDNTISNLLSEAHRILENNKTLLIKLPDYDWFMQNYKNKNQTFMNGMGIDKVVWSWEGKVPDDILNRLSFMICGYWNYSYGDPYKKEVNRVPEAYCGPAKFDQTELKELFESSSIRKIVKTLRAKASEDTQLKAFNHQNAWSLKEFSQVLNEHNFEVLNTDRDSIIKQFENFVPDIRTHDYYSMYLTAQKI